MNLSSTASLCAIAQARSPALSLSFFICKLGQEPLALRAAVQPIISHQIAESPDCWQAGLTAPTPFPEPLVLPAPHLLLRVGNDIAHTERPGLRSETRRLRGGGVQGSPRDQRPNSQVVSTDGRSRRCPRRVASAQLGAAEGSKWLPGRKLPKESGNPGAFCVAPTPGPWGPATQTAEPTAGWMEQLQTGVPVGSWVWHHWLS